MLATTGMQAFEPGDKRQSRLDQLPDEALVRLSEIVPSKKHPHRPSLLPISKATVWRMVKAGRFPQPVRLGAQAVAWRMADLRSWISWRAERGVQ